MQRLGVRQAAIVQRLNEEGLKISESAFRNALFRIRKAQSEKQNVSNAPNNQGTSNTQRPSAENKLIIGGATETAHNTEAQKTVQQHVQAPVKTVNKNSTQALSEKIRSSTYDPLADD